MTAYRVVQCHIRGFINATFDVSDGSMIKGDRGLVGGDFRNIRIV
ncbi:MAG: hypothetical protein BWY82_02618 [Verrucomicrobia bacterium ADurb.Bin474]|nr:MAG: hypothetical protein BWY82_02618 [Verrucomicrobia bacterium ADurb.Bin474]